VKRTARLWLWLIVPVIGCGPGAPADREPLRVAAASDLQAAFGELAEAFQRQSGVPVDFVAGSSGNLARQIRQGAPFDVFLSADRARVRELAEEGIVRPESVRAYAIGSLVVAVSQASGVAVASLDDLARPEVKRIAIANPDHAPYGAAARQALQRAGLWEALEPRLAMAETVRQALQFVQTGNAEAGLVGRAIADVPGIAVVPVDPGLHDPIVQALGIVAASRRGGEAGRFAAFLLGPDGQKILARKGFKPPAE
jgi:molybdate transport system substrate-binding protein